MSLQRLREDAWWAPTARAVLTILVRLFFLNFFGTSGWCLGDGRQGHGTLPVVVHDVVQDFVLQVHWGGNAKCQKISDRAQHQKLRDAALASALRQADLTWTWLSRDMIKQRNKPSFHRKSLLFMSYIEHEKKYEKYWVINLTQNYSNPYMCF